MYGSVGRLQIKSGRLIEVKRVIQELEDVPGVLAMFLVGKDGSADEYRLAIGWTDRGARDADAIDINFLTRHQRLLDTLTNTPECHSGEVVYAISQ